MADATTSLPDDVRLLLSDHIDSYEQLQVLLRLRRDAPKTWDAVGLSVLLDLPCDTVGGALRALASRALAEEEMGRYRFDPRDAERVQTIERLATIFEERPLDVIRQVTADAIARVRRSAAQKWAETKRREREGSN